AVLADAVEISTGPHRPGLRVREEVGSVARMALAQPGGYQELDGLPKQLVARVAEQSLDLAVDEDDLSDAIDHHHAARRGLHRGAEPRFGALAGGDIDHGGEHEQSLVGFDRVQADLHRHLGAVLADAVEISPRSHRPGLRVREEVRSVAGMALAQPVGDEELNRLAEQLIARVAEQSLDLAVDEDDLSGAIDHHHAARRRLDHRAEPRVRLPACGQFYFELPTALAAHRPGTRDTPDDQDQRDD